ncbi:MAG: hypothetical protein IT323_15800 [Anaerolineae bacterium]|nr:hypothetical protein [Anaerolineae bacterium]
MSAAARFEDQRKDLERVQTLYAAQPAAFQRAIDAGGAALAAALRDGVYRFALAAPLVGGEWPASRDGALLRLEAGGWWSRLRKSPRRDALIERLASLSASPDAATASTADVLRLSTGNALIRGLPARDQLERECVAFDGRGRLLLSEADAAGLVARLGQWMERLRLAERVFPPLATGDAFNAAAERLTQAITQQGRSLARLYNDQLIEEVRTGWKSGQIARSLTLLVPYLDEASYLIARFPVVVVPTGRIPFRPEFVVSACRIAERQARNLGSLTQATRWQLITHLDQIAQAFEQQNEAH